MTAIPDDEARDLAFARDRHPEREADDREHQAGDRERELLLYRHLLLVDGDTGLLLRGDLFAQLRDRQLVDAAHQLEVRKDRVGVELDGQVLVEAVRLDVLPVRRAVRVPRSVLQHERDGLLLAVQEQTPFVRHVQDRLVRLTRVGDEHVLPAAAGLRQIADVDHPAREVREKELGPYVVFHLLRDDRVGELAEGLVCVGNGLEHDPEMRRAGEGCQEEQRSEQPVWADAARQERDRFAIAGHATEADERADQERHGDRQPERLRNQHRQHPDRDAERDAFGDERLELVHDRRNQEEEREDDERQERRRDDFADQVTVEDFQRIDVKDTAASSERQCLDDWAATEGGRPETAARSFHRPVLRALRPGSDNVCYVNQTRGSGFRDRGSWGRALRIRGSVAVALVRGPSFVIRGALVVRAAWSSFVVRRFGGWGPAAVLRSATVSLTKAVPGWWASSAPDASSRSDARVVERSGRLRALVGRLGIGDRGSGIRKSGIRKSGPLAFRIPDPRSPTPPGYADGFDAGSGNGDFGSGAFVKTKFLTGSNARTDLGIGRRGSGLGFSIPDP